MLQSGARPFSRVCDWETPLHPDWFSTRSARDHQAPDTASVPASHRTPCTRHRCCARYRHGTAPASADRSSPAGAARRRDPSSAQFWPKAMKNCWSPVKPSCIGRGFAAQRSVIAVVAAAMPATSAMFSASVCLPFTEDRGTACRCHTAPPAERSLLRSAPDPPASTSCAARPWSRTRSLRCRRCG